MQVLERKFDLANTRKNYKKVVPFYDFWSRLTESKSAKKVIDLAEVSDGKKILEVACGTGLVFKQIVQRNPNGINIGIDLSPDMLSRARWRLQKSSGNYELLEGNAMALNYQDNYFDTVINNFMIDLMPAETFDLILGEFYRVVKPGGIAVLSVFSKGTKRIHGFWFWLAKEFPDLLTGCRPVSINENLKRAGFVIEIDLQMSQNTFPSEIIKVRKPIP